MKIKGAVLREVTRKSPLHIEELELEDPKANEVLVKNSFTGVCHSDVHYMVGDIPVELPMILGHETAGIVEKVGPGVTAVKEGDHVVSTWMIPCGHCKQCQRGKGHICTTNLPFMMSGMLLDGTSRLKDEKGEMVRHSGCTSGFATFSVMPEAGVIPLPKDVPLDQACFMACCTPTGWGAVNNKANVKVGDSVAVFGVGGVGLNVIRAAALNYANPIIAVDLESRNEDIAREFGATHFIDSSKEDPVPKIKELTDDGVDYAFEVRGSGGLTVQAYWSLGLGGKLIVIGVTRFDEPANLELMLLPLHELEIIGCLYGSISTHTDIPRLIELNRGGAFKLDKLITKYIRLEEINDAVHAMLDRKIVGRWVIKFD